jgi:hypothetical protein
MFSNHPIFQAKIAEGFAFGCFLGSLVFCGAIATLLSSDVDLIEAENFFFGSVALLAAFLSLLGINRQVKSNLRLAAEETERKRLGALAKTPIALSNVTTQVKKIVNWHLKPGHDFPIEFEQFDKDFYQGLTPEKRLMILLSLIAQGEEYAPPTGLERVSRVIKLNQKGSGRYRGPGRIVFRYGKAASVMTLLFFATTP